MKKAKAKKKVNISVIMPALNEEKNVLAAIDNTLKAFEEFNINGEIVVVDDGSTDGTGDLVNHTVEKDSRVRLICHQVSRGIGASFWDGVDNANGGIILMIPGDNENDPWEILRYHKLVEHVDIVIPFIFNKEARPLFRNALSFVYRFIVNTTFLVNFNYTNGTVLYRKSILKELDYRGNGFFFQTDILIRTVKRGYLFAEVPCRVGLRREGVSKAVTFPSLLQVMRGYLHLVRDLYGKKHKKSKVHFSGDSLTASRRNAPKSTDSQI